MRKWIDEMSEWESSKTDNKKNVKELFQTKERKKTSNLKNHTHASRFIQMSLQYNSFTVISFAQQQEKVLYTTKHMHARSNTLTHNIYICIFIKKVLVECINQKHLPITAHESALLHTPHHYSTHKKINRNQIFIFTSKFSQMKPNRMEWTTKVQV